MMGALIAVGVTYQIKRNLFLSTGVELAKIRSTFLLNIAQILVT